MVQASNARDVNRACQGRDFCRLTCIMSCTCMISLCFGSLGTFHCLSFDCCSTMPTAGFTVVISCTNSYLTQSQPGATHMHCGDAKSASITILQTSHVVGLLRSLLHVAVALKLSDVFWRAQEHWQPRVHLIWAYIEQVPPSIRPLHDMIDRHNQKSSLVTSGSTSITCITCFQFVEEHSCRAPSSAMTCPKWTTAPHGA